VTAIPTLQTERLTLRAPSATDFPLYAAFYAVGEKTGVYSGPRDEVDAWKVLAADAGHWALRGFGKWVMVRRDTGAGIGGCGLVHNGGWPRPELTWWLMPDQRGHGFAAEASRAAIAFGYDALGWSLVETHMRDENAPARRLAARLGGGVIARDVFPDGVARDVFALPRAADAAIPAGAPA